LIWPDPREEQAMANQGRPRGRLFILSKAFTRCTRRGK
jgi:hypothetical protein